MGHTALDTNCSITTHTENYSVTLEQIPITPNIQYTRSQDNAKLCGSKQKHYKEIPTITIQLKKNILVRAEYSFLDLTEGTTKGTYNDHFYDFHTLDCKCLNTMPQQNHPLDANTTYVSKEYTHKALTAVGVGRMLEYN